MTGKIGSTQWALVHPNTMVSSENHRSQAHR